MLPYWQVFWRASSLRMRTRTGCPRARASFATSLSAAGSLAGRVRTAGAGGGPQEGARFLLFVDRRMTIRYGLGRGVSSGGGAES